MAHPTESSKEMNECRRPRRTIFEGLLLAVFVWSAGVLLGAWAAAPLASEGDRLPLPGTRPLRAQFTEISGHNLLVLGVAASGALTHFVFTAAAVAGSGLVFGLCVGDWQPTPLDLWVVVSGYASWEWLGLWLAGAVGFRGGRLPCNQLIGMLGCAVLLTLVGAWRESRFVESFEATDPRASRPAAGAAADRGNTPLGQGGSGESAHQRRKASSDYPVTAKDLRAQPSFTLLQPPASRAYRPRHIPTL